MSERIALDLAFKGDRTYLQAGDIYQAVVSAAQIGETERVRLFFRRFTGKACELVLGPSAEMTSDQTDGVAQLIAGSGETSRTGWIVETGEQVLSRRPFDEDRIVASMKVGDGKAAMIAVVPFAPIEIAIALTKRLHKLTFRDVKGKWIVSKLDLDRPLVGSDVERLEIVLAQKLGTRLTKSVLSVDSQRLGEIWFSLVDGT